MSTCFAPILTIAIPTYNRSRYLGQCLSALIPQVLSSEGLVRLVIVDNCSTDETPHVAERYSSEYNGCLEYIRNPENIGADRNIARCFELCLTKYAWVFGDDDVLMPGALEKILYLLKRSEFGVVHIKAFPYKGDPFDWAPKRKSAIYEVVGKSQLEGMAYKVSDMFSFITGNIVNKDLVPSGMDLYRYVDTKYNQIQWVFSALFAAETNLYIDDGLLAINNEEQSGGYPFCRVFGTNYNIFFKIFIGKGIDQAFFDVINRKMARELFPALIYHARMTGGSYRNYTPENYFEELRPSYEKYAEFWLCVAPMCKLPLFALYPHFFAVRVINKFIRLFK